ncbi:hypothetical protein EVAR_41505_1 [Eumeta japonica]|uniref:Uncharacterized protein n=1 Tax=Eumeta variegata TaxID=151549 RepID=A0A4C1X287_EUMVA|nr:hypothetical protein EVAR_41505_1 [Eumeta japonica]
MRQCAHAPVCASQLTVDEALNANLFALRFTRMTLMRLGRIALVHFAWFRKQNPGWEEEAYSDDGRKEIDASQGERLGRSCLSIACTALSLARSAQAERDNASCFFVRATGVHRFIRRYHVKILQDEANW